MAEKAYCEQCNRNFPNEDALAMHNSAKHPISENKKRLSKKTVFIIAILSVLLIAGFLFFENRSATGNAINNQNIQKITLGFKNYNYYPNTIKVKANQPVEITLDNSVRGCFRNFNIKSLGVSEYSSAPSQTITFTPDKKGSFEFACGMRMAYGTLIVE